MSIESAKQRRDKLRADGWCINGESHGPPAAGSTKCEWCKLVARRGIVAALADPNAPPRPPNHRARKAPDFGNIWTD